MSPFLDYTPPQKDSSEIHTEELTHAYYVQLAPDGKHLVPGILQQQEHPNIGRWVQVGKITRDFPKRYFVQCTDFNTLVPGSLIQADRLPQGKWKEVKKNSVPVHHFVVSGLIQGNLYSSTNDWQTFDSMDYFNYVIDDLGVMEKVYPDLTNDELFENPFTYRLYYFYGSYQQWNGDISRLTLFHSLGSLMRIYNHGNNTYTDTFQIYPQDDGVFLQVLGSAPVGYYMIVLGILNDVGDVVNYIALENYLHKMT